MKKVLFVCMGNICRSPAAEGVFLHHLSKAGLSHRIDVDSAGTTGYHQGERADKRMRAAALAEVMHWRAGLGVSWQRTLITLI